MQVANAPVSYGAFELTVGIVPNVPDAERVLDAIAEAGYDGTELGPPGYLGEGDLLDERLRRRGLALAGAFVEIRFGTEGLGELERTLDAIAGHDAKAVLCDKGPRDGDVELGAVSDAAELARGRGFEPTFHPHLGTRVQTPSEIERLLSGTDVPLLLDTGHLTAAGGDAVAAVRKWGERVNHVHLKDVHNGVFCELGAGEVDLRGVLSGLDGYSGWLVVEHDWIPKPGESADAQIVAQARNRRWLREHAGV
jgi:inosose dehydratase